MGGTPFRHCAQITQNSYRTWTRKQWIRQTCSNEKAETQLAEGGTNLIANQRLSIGLEIFWNCYLYVLKQFSVKKNWRQKCVFLVLFLKLVNKHF